MSCTQGVEAELASGEWTSAAVSTTAILCRETESSMRLETLISAQLLTFVYSQERCLEGMKKKTYSSGDVGNEASIAAQCMACSVGVK